MNPNLNYEKDVFFDADFECGNLDLVFKNLENTPYENYECLMRVDSNSSGHMNWFNFKIRNPNKIAKNLHLKISNFTRSKSLYQRVKNKKNR
jgi:cytosolic carboxypeptidase protein 2/3